MTEQVRSASDEAAALELESENERLQGELARLRGELARLRAELEEPSEIVRAIRFGEVDGFVVQDSEGEAIYHLRSADVLCRAMVEEMREGAVAVDESGTVLYCNRCFSEMVGRGRDELLGSRIQSLVPAEGRFRFRELLRRCDRTVHEQFWIEAASQRRVAATVTVTPLRVDDQKIYCLVWRDADRERLEEESRRKDEFLAVLGHELRGPLAPIRNAAQLLRLREERDEQLDWIGEVIDRQVQQMTRLVDDLLDIARIVQGKVRLEMKDIDLAELATRAIETVRPRIEGKGHELQVSFAAAPVHARGDGARLLQVLTNLLDNAVKFTPPGGRIVLAVEREGDDGVIRVADDGDGIPADHLQRIFDLFAQADSSPARPRGGLGIGLSLVRGVVETHGGTVEASSEGPGKGAEFVVRLPLSAAAGGSTEAHVPLDDDADAEAQLGRVLVVDDDEDTRESVVKLVETWGYSARAAANGRAALGLAASFRPDVILIDIGLPEMNGYELAKRLRSLDVTERAWMIALSGWAQAEDRRRGEEVGIDHYLVKPADPGALAELLASCRAR